MAKNTSAMQTTTLQNRKADVCFSFFNCILLWTTLYSSGGHESKAGCLLCRWRWWLLIPWQEFPNVVPIGKDRMCSCSGSSLVSGIQWASLNAPVAPARVCNPCLWERTLCMTEDPLSQKHGWDAPLMWWLICYFSLCFVFSSCLYLLHWLYHPSKAFLIKLLCVTLLLV